MRIPEIAFRKKTKEQIIGSTKPIFHAPHIKMPRIKEQLSSTVKPRFHFHVPHIKIPRITLVREGRISNLVKSISSRIPHIKIPKIPLAKISTKQVLTILAPVFLVPVIILMTALVSTWQARAAATIYWDGGGDGTTWTNPLNWNTNVIPVATDDVLIDTASTVIITAPITVNSLVLGKSAGTVASVLEFKYDAISTGALTISNGDLTVYPAASIIHTAGSGSSVVGKININVQVGNANIYGNINADGKGSPDRYGSGAGISGSGGAGGASHGGYGGNGKTQLGNTTVYDSMTQPVALGSGGGDYNSTNTAGEGGGAVKLTVAGTTTINGVISANGTIGTSQANGGGGGSGGAIWLTSNSFVGSGSVTANGGDSRDESSDAGGGGGGRIALYYTSNSLTQSQLSAMGGRPLGADAPAQKGGAGTVYLKSTGATNGNLIIDNKVTTWNTNQSKVAQTPLDSNLTIDNLTVDNYANVPVTTSLTVVSALNIANYSFLDIQNSANITYATLSWAGGTIIDSGGTFPLFSGSSDITVLSGATYVADSARTFHNGTINGTITNTANTTTETYKINLTFTGDLTISPTGSINVDGKGFKDSYGPGKSTDGTGAGGASHGGTGGNGQGLAGSTVIYGSVTEPFTLGSGGGDPNFNGVGYGGYGGGAIKLAVSGTANINGNVTANGVMGTLPVNEGAGGGSGGSIWLTANSISGSGTITTNGGDGYDCSWGDGGGGGGGRISLNYTTKTFSGTLGSRGGIAKGSGGRDGGPGTIFTKASGATNGDLVYDNTGTTNPNEGTGKGYGVISTSSTFDNITVSNKAILEVSSSATVVGTLKLETDSYLRVQSAANISYGTFTWGSPSTIIDNGGFMPLLANNADFTIPAGNVYIANTARTFHSGTIDGTITNLTNMTTETYKINLTFTGDLTISPTGSINVDGKGFKDGYGPGKSTDGVAAGGASHGGTGGNGQGLAGSTVIYGSVTEPFTLGSGGGDPNFNGVGYGGYGGGAIKLAVSGTANINGNVTANGVMGTLPANEGAGGGSGGSIWLIANSISGSGTIAVNGGNSPDTNYDGGGGGGGRIALNYTTKTFTGSLESKGGKANGLGRDGGPGTIFTKASSATNGDLVYDNNGTTNPTDGTGKGYGVISTSSTFDNITVRNKAILEISSGLTITGALSLETDSYLRVQPTANISYATFNWGSPTTIIDNGGVMPLLANNTDFTVPAGSIYAANTARTFHNGTVNGIITNTANTTVETYKVNLTFTGDLAVSSTGSIDVTAKGYMQGVGPGKGAGGVEGPGGGGYGGTGGIGQGGALGGITYGDLVAPINLGSGGGLRNADNAGAGGGAIKLIVSGTSTINGTIIANGGSVDSPDTRYQTSGGSGGSIWLTTGSLAGNGTISANGGAAKDGSNYDGGGGGGGRIAINYTTKTFIGALEAKGGVAGAGGRDGGSGSVYTKATGTNGDLVFDNTGTANVSDEKGKGYSVISTPYTLDNVTVRNRSTLEISSTVTLTGTLSLETDSNLRVQPAANISYGTFNWGSPTMIIDNGGVIPLLANNVDLTIPANSIYAANTTRTFHNGTVNGIITNTANTTVETYKVNLTFTGDLTIPSTGSIDVTAKGYMQGTGPGKGAGGVEGPGGGGYGGKGGNGQGGALGGTTYGNSSTPTDLGSGGGLRNGTVAGAGGGAIKLTITGISTVNGAILANGGYGDDGNCWQTSGGSGGSIWINTGSIVGSGSISANGGAATDGSCYDGGGGGGGRIALYYASKNFSVVTTAGGVAGPSAQAGSSGTIYLAGKPTNPLTLNQFKADGTTAIGIGGTTNETSMIASFQVADANDTDTLTPEVEIQPVGTAFNNVATGTGTPVTYSGTPVLATVTVNGLADNVEYHWQARACDSTAQCSAWVSAGNNTEAQSDIKVVMNTAPNSPVIPEASYYINGQYTNYVKPNIGFVLSDPNSADSVGYQIQIGTDATFATVNVDYISGMSAQGTQSFTVGQAAGTGSYNTGAEAQELTTADYYWRVKAIDSKGSQSGWTVASGTPAFRIDLSRPTNASNVRMKASATALNEYTESANTIWFNNNGLYFKWDTGTDIQGVKGYCLYLGTEINGDPATEKGLLGTSPISTTGSTCSFITDQTEIDFSNSALRSYEWLTSSNDKYYFKVKTIDIANNTFEGPDDTNFISFNFDNTAPQNVTAISAPSSAFSSTSDMYINWPTANGSGGSDLNSGVLGFQYAVNSRDTWYGDSVDPMTGLTYSLLTREQPLYFPQAVKDIIQLGQNIVYFRVIDNAGNFSELRTVYINFGGEAPKFAEGEQVTVTPSQSNENSFAFSWPAATASAGNEIATYYYMVNTPPPVSYATITSNSATYIATTARSIAKNSVAGLRKGANTIYVVAVDTSGNYASTNTISATFHLNTELPDPPTNLIIADSSIKDVSLWRAALIWDEPVYKGTGSLTYYIQRSEDSENWETIKTTTGMAHIDTVTDSKRYYWRVGTVDNSDESAASPSYSNAVSIIPRGKYTVAPSITSGPAASSLTTTRATLSWTTSRVADSKVAIGLASGNYFEWEPSVSLHTTDHMIPLSNLKPGTEYFYKAKWTDEDGNTGESVEKTFTTNPPPEVKEVRISNLGISGAIVNFTTKNASNVKIFYGPTTSFGGVKEVATSKLETTYAAELTQLQDGTKYYYKINTFDEEGEEYEGTTLDFTTLPRPKVSNVLVQQVAKTAQSTLLVTWESNTAVSSVVTFYPEKNPELMKDTVELALVKGEHKMLVKGLFPDTVYILRVRGTDIIGNEAVSENIRITTSTDSRPPQISAMNIEGANLAQSEGTTQTTASQLIVTWTTDEPATSQVEYGEGSSDTYAQLTQEDKDLSYNHVVIIAGLTPAKVYHLRAISKDSAANESKSIDTVTITPKATNNAFYLVITTLQEAFNFLGNLSSK